MTRCKSLRASRRAGLLLRFAALMFVAALPFLTAQAQTPRVSLTTVWPGGLQNLVYVTSARDGTNRKFMVLQSGRILVIQPQSPNSATPFLDITSRVLSGGERGLLGLAFHPQFATNGRFYVNYTRQPDGATVVAEYRQGVEQRILFTVAQPYENHNGGMIEFGPDGYLYVGMGDGGSGNDPQNHAQNPTDLLGKILRINVNAAGSQPEIYALGFRNPWRFSFDRLTGQLYVGDVGQNAREEIDIVVRGGNYGWRVVEGTQCTGLGPAPCSTPGFIPPITEYVNNGATGGRCSVIGGYVYRGTQGTLPYGAYIFGDLCTGEIFMFKDGVQSLLVGSGSNLSSFGEDEAGELYVVKLSGFLYRITNPNATTTAVRPFTTPAPSSVFVTSTAGAASLTTGYARLQPDELQQVPSGLALFQFEQGGVLASEASVAATKASTSGRVFAQMGNGVNTGIALANPSNDAATVSVYFTDASGTNFGSRELTISPRQQLAAFLTESPFNGPASLTGTFSFTSSVPIAAVALRGFTNERGEFLMTTLPVAELGATAGTTIVPHFADVGGWSTQLALVNPTDDRVTGTAQFRNRTGGVVQTSPYDIPPRSSVVIATSGQGGVAQTGSVRLSAAAVASSIFSLKAGGITVAQTGVAASDAATAFRAYVENAPAVRTAIAIANPSAATVNVNLELSGVGATTIQVPPNGQTALFVTEIPGFAGLSASFQGVLRITSAVPIAVTSLHGHTNARGDFLVTATPPLDESAEVPAELFLPHVAEGAGYSIQFVVFGRASSGTLSFFEPSGAPLPLTFR